MKKRSIFLLISMILATSYLVYVVSYFMKESGSNGGAVASLLVLPHIALLFFGVVFGWIGYFSRKTGFSLAAAILFCVSAAMFVLYAMFLAPSIVLEFVGYSNQKTINGK